MLRENLLNELSLDFGRFNWKERKKEKEKKEEKGRLSPEVALQLQD